MKIDNCSILVVDDEPDIRDILAFHLEGIGATVKTVGDGNEAAQLINKEKFHIVISDLNLPGMNGLKLLCESKSLHGQSQIFVLVTGGNEPEPEPGPESHSPDAVLLKPFAKKQLIELIEKLLSSNNQALAA